MAVVFAQTWPTAGAGSTNVSSTNERALQKIAGTFDMSAQEAYLTNDGTDSGDPSLFETVPEAPMIALIAEDAQDQSALTTAGSFGPVMDPADSIGRDLFMWRYEHTASGWKLTVYLSGIESSGLFDGSGAGRGFAALIAGLGEP